MALPARMNRLVEGGAAVMERRDPPRARPPPRVGAGRPVADHDATLVAARAVVCIPDLPLLVVLAPRPSLVGDRPGWVDVTIPWSGPVYGHQGPGHAHSRWRKVASVTGAFSTRLRVCAAVNCGDGTGGG
jgi:hypothetical protein